MKKSPGLRLWRTNGGIQEGDFAPLHKINPVRLEFIRDHLCELAGTDPVARMPFDGLNILDIGCGGGLLCEPLSRLGASVTGIDAGERNIRIAANHATRMGLDIKYHRMSPEEAVADGQRYDVVLNMEVIEHVADINVFHGGLRCARPTRGAWSARH